MDPDILFKEACDILSKKASLLDIISSNKEKKYESAQHLFDKCARLYKLSKQYNKATDAYEQSARCFLTLNNDSEAATAFMNAFETCQKYDIKGAIQYASDATKIYTNLASPNDISKCNEKLAICYESINDHKQALIHYTACLSVSEIENKSYSINKFRLKIAGIYIHMQRYDDAAEIYEKLAETCINTLEKFRLNEYLTSAMICTLEKHDYITASKKFQSIIDTHKSYEESSDGRFISDLLSAIKESNMGLYTTTLDRFKRLPDWQVNVLSNLETAMTSDDANDVC